MSVSIALETLAGLLAKVARVATRITWFVSSESPLKHAASLSTRLHLFLNTAFPSRLGATKATLPKPPSSSTRAVMRTSLWFARLPPKKTLSKSRLDLMVLIAN